MEEVVLEDIREKKDRLKREAANQPVVVEDPDD